jgi:CheY-like chemotaxis protein
MAEKLASSMKLGKNWRSDATPVAPPKLGSDNAPVFSSGTDEGAAASVGQNRKILVVDDNPVVLKAFELKLKSSGFQVFTALDAAHAISCALDEVPDLIVLDFNLPPDVGSTGTQWNGLTIMQWLRRLRESFTIPVVIISSTSADKLRDEALTAGATAFFQKPIDHKELLGVIQKVLHLPV